MTELLAPAGSMESFIAACANGADAIYLSGKNFGARAFAENFTEPEIIRAIELAHFYHKKVFVTVNTLLADDEIPDALRYVARLYNAGVDAVIFQDLGLMSLLRRIMPDLPLHASTQLTVHNLDGVNFLAGCGIKRAILARELSFADLAVIRKGSTIELEAFVHGALCVCYSGQCLFSSMVGGRSGNRGKCAQPCRMSYDLVDEFGNTVITKLNGNHLLSPRDLSAFDNLEELHGLGLDSWKIEGRMKKPEYVATVCRIYSNYLRLLDDNRIIYPDEDDLRQLLQVFNREFSSGYWHGNPGSELMSYGRPNNRGLFLGRIDKVEDGMVEMTVEQPLHLGDGVEIWVTTGGRNGFTVSKIFVNDEEKEEAQPKDRVRFPAKGGKAGDRVFKTYDILLSQSVQTTVESLPPKRLDFVIRAVCGEALTVSATDSDGLTAQVVSDYVVELARTSSTDWHAVTVQLARLGGTGYVVGSVDGELDDDIILPASVLNACRRDLVAQLTSLHNQRNSYVPLFESALQEEISRFCKRESVIGKTKAHVSALVVDEKQAKLAADHGAGDIYLDAEGFRGRKRVNYRELAHVMREHNCRLIPYLPQIIYDRDEEFWLDKLKEWQELELASVVCNNPGQLVLVKKSGWQGQIYAGTGMNIFNRATGNFLVDQGVSRLALSPEMTLEQLRNFSSPDAELEFFVQGALQLMVSEYCALGAVQGGRTLNNACARPCLKNNGLALRDEKDYVFPVRCDNHCRMHVFNSRDLCLLADTQELLDAGISSFLLDLRLYESGISGRLVELYNMALRDKWGLEEAKAKISRVITGYTKGHLYRGV